MRPSYTRNNLETATIDFEWDITPEFSLVAGVSTKRFEFSTQEFRRTANTEVAPPLSAGDCNGDGVRVQAPCSPS